MGALDILWVFVIVSALQPVLKQKLLEAGRYRMIARIEQRHGSRVILLVHRQETMSILGFPVMRYIDINDSEAVLRAIQLTDPTLPIDLVLHTPGGIAFAAVQIARAIRDHKGKVTAFIPHYAMSGGTLIALAADDIVMCSHSTLGPLDPQLGQSPAASILSVLEKKPLAEIDDQTLILADQAAKAVAQMREIIKDLLSDRYTPEQADTLARTLSEGRWTHDYTITCQQAKALGLPVSDAMPPEMLELMQLFPQPVRYTPSVEYLPTPRRAPTSERHSEQHRR